MASHPSSITEVEELPSHPSSILKMVKFLQKSRFLPDCMASHGRQHNPNGTVSFIARLNVCNNGSYTYLPTAKCSKASTTQVSYGYKCNVKQCQLTITVHTYAVEYTGSKTCLNFIKFQILYNNLSKYYSVTLQVLIVTTMKITVFSDLIPCSPVEISQRSPETSANCHQTTRRHIPQNGNLQYCSGQLYEK
jgi:hypothetical protein